MVVEVRFDKGVPHLRLDAAWRSGRGRVDPVMSILARTNGLILDGHARAGILFLERAVLEIIEKKALDEQSFPLLLRLIVLYEKSGIIEEECEKGLDAFRAALALFKKDGRLESWEMEVQRRLAKALLEYAQKDDAGGANNGFYRMAKAELEDLIARYPYFAPAKEMLEKQLKWD